ncbi:hypothetical protein [Pseudidiomarina gelatinasegens]|uniref:hypothetical protein n=1 Tax=Pseudidiomarina gelatinasegens TaxID=2487740 RepID=UPI003A979BF1
MSRYRDPWDIPEWHALGREAALVRHLIGSGATALGKANYADQIGEYYNAFFGLSVGLERLAKLILVADYAIANGGKMPNEKEIRKFGHNLLRLTNAVDSIVLDQGLALTYSRPTTEVSSKIIDCLDAFADARRGRYANFVSLDDPNFSREEPIGKWWNEVAEVILKQYYYGKFRQKRVEARAEIMDMLMSPISIICHTDENQNSMQDVRSASIRTGQTEIVQRFGRYNALVIARWLSEVFSVISFKACYQHGVRGFFGIDEYFYTYTVDDQLLKSRKKWPLR